MELEEILQSLKSGKVTVSKAQKLLSLYSIEKIENFAKLDTNRMKRKGIPEVIFGENKQFLEIKKNHHTNFKKIKFSSNITIKQKRLSKNSHICKKIKIKDIDWNEFNISCHL